MPSTMASYLMRMKWYFIVIDDIWSISVWEHLKSALPINENRSRVITTTRNKDVAKSCCTGFDGHTYEAKLLTDEDSHSLFFRRVFCSSKDCPQELTEVASEILRKCGGLPLAIISVASLLANKSETVEVWVKIRKSISSDVEKDSIVDKMKRILFLSYFDLPHYLKTCLLYLSVFPEDCSIDSRRLIRIWIAEGLVPGQNRESMELLGESYLNELINRSMIQPTKIGVDGKTVKSCRVHDIVLDFIISQAEEDNFVNILNGNDFCGQSSNKIRRLSLQAAKFSEVSQLPKLMKHASHLRSIHMFGSDHPEQWMTRFLSSQVLRVVNIENSRSLENSHIEHIGSFLQLKYLRIVRTDISNLPEQIGKLQHLEILDLRGSKKISELPTSIVQLQKLVCLLIDPRVALPDGIGSLQALEELSLIDINSASLKAIQGLGELAKLRALRILPRGYDEGREKAWTSSLSKLVARSLRSLDFMKFSSCRDYSWMSSCDSPPPLRRLVCIIDTIPSEIGSLFNLTRLSLQYIREVGEEGFKILASLPMLLSLTLRLMLNDDVPYQRQIIGGQGFQRLVKFNFSCVDWAHGAGLMFEPGAMPKLQRLKLGWMARCQLKYGGLGIGLQHLSGLKHITVGIDCFDAVADEVEAEGDIRGAGIHPNCPILEIQTMCIEIDVNLACMRCYTKIQKVLCKIKVKYNIKSVTYDTTKNQVTISGFFDPHTLHRVLRCKAGDVIQGCVAGGLNPP